MSTVVLHDPNGNNVVSALATSSVGGSPTSTITWNFAAGTTPPVITAGSSYTLTLWGDLSTIPSISQQSQSLTATIKAYTDFSYLDATDVHANTVNLTTNEVPITVASLQTGAGGVF
jgi:hypothetical protein